MVELVTVKVDLEVQGLPAPPLPSYARERARVLATSDAEVEVNWLQVKVEPEVLGERHLTARAAAKSAPRAGARLIHRGAEELTARLVEHGQRWSVEPQVQQARAVRAELRAGGRPTHGGAEELMARPAERDCGGTKPDVKGRAVAAVKWRLVGADAYLGGAFCRRSRPRAPPPQQQQPTCVRSAKRRAISARGGAGGPGPRVEAEEAAAVGDLQTEKMCDGADR